MSIVLELTTELEEELSAEAASLGLPLADYAVRLLSRGGDTVGNVRTGADLISYWKDQGLIGTRDDISNPEQYAQELRRKAEKRLR